MPTTGQIIDAAHLDYLSASSPTIATDGPKRDRARRRFTEVSQKTWTKAPHWWRLTSSPLTIPGGTGAADMPPDFLHMGTEGNIFLDEGNRRRPLRYVSPQEFFQLRQSALQQANLLSHYTLHGRSTTLPGVPRIEVWPAVDSDQDLIVAPYTRTTPAMVDHPLSPSVSVDSPGLLTGDFDWAVTFVHPAGETEAGPAATLVLASEQALLEEIDTDVMGVATARNIYRRDAAANGPYERVGVIADNVTTTFIDNDNTPGPENPPDPALAFTGAEAFPEDFHYTCLLNGLESLLMRGQGDVRDSKVRDEWLSDATRMWGEMKQGQNEVQALAAYQGAKKGAGWNSAAHWRHRIPG